MPTSGYANLSRTQQPQQPNNNNNNQPRGRPQLLLNTDELRKWTGKKYCDEAELVPLLLAQQHGPGSPAGSMAGPVARAVQVYNAGVEVRMPPTAAWPAGHAP